MNKIIFVLSIFIIFLSYKFFFSDTSYSSYKDLKNQVLVLEEKNTKFNERIEILKAEIKNLQEGLGVVEEKARNELGLIKEKETFYQILK
jgi:cell division protein FtsB|tara:strand:+ start:3779 stop:4048 length:270 start_codon:yes stop_codon:yes gene_type:complete